MVVLKVEYFLSFLEGGQGGITTDYFSAVFRIRRVHKFLDLPDPDPLVRGTDPSIIKQKK
jgi:hypothetical protein